MTETNLIHTSLIKVPPDRQRKEFNPVALLELKGSIRRFGLFNPIQLQADNVTLQSGETRLRVIKELHAEGHEIRHNGNIVPIGFIPFTKIHEVVEVDRFEMELHENLHRSELTWQERAAATARLHELRKSQTGGEWTQRDTAREIASIEGKEATSQDEARVGAGIQVAAYLSDPDVAGAADEREARKIIRKKLEASEREKKRHLFEKVIDGRYTLVNTSMEAGIKTVADGSIQVIVTDPPYGIGADGFGSQATTEHEYSDDPEDYMDLMRVFAVESYRVAAREAHLYMFFDIRWFMWLRKVFKEAGWEPWPRPMVWDKCGTGMLPRPEHGPRYTHEYILFCNKGDRRVSAVYADVIGVLPVQDKKHAAEKPVDLYVNLLQRSVLPGDMVADFFAGSGPIFPAAHKLSVKALGIEKSELHYNVALERIAGLK